jgi:hypothetical protein
MRALLAAGAGTAVMNRYDEFSEYEHSAVDDVLNDAALQQQPVSEAAVAESILTVQALVAAGCSLYAKLHRAVSSSRERGKVTVLLACGADPYELDEDSLTAMHNAASFAGFDADELADDDWLLDDSAEPVNVLNIQALYDAAGDEGAELVNCVEGADSSTPLHYGARISSSVQKLLQLGADAALLDAKGRSALHMRVSAAVLAQWSCCWLQALTRMPTAVRLRLKGSGSRCTTHAPHAPLCPRLAQLTLMQTTCLDTCGAAACL